MVSISVRISPTAAVRAATDAVSWSSADWLGAGGWGCWTTQTLGTGAPAVLASMKRSPACALKFPYGITITINIIVMVTKTQQEN